jgi:hypothetical protein
MLNNQLTEINSIENYKLTIIIYKLQTSHKNQTGPII